MEICSQGDCTGCGLCSKLCPQNTIEMKEDSIGHLQPFIMEEKCVNCGLCKRICPANNFVQTNHALEAYASWAKEQDVRMTSTSGGIASILARYFIQCDVVVYGSALENGTIKHIRITTIDEISKLQGSKYVESPIIEVIPLILDDIRQGKNIAFFGTPCQCAAVKKLGSRYEKQICLIEVICSGVPPQKLLWDHLDIENPKKVQFRDKSGSRLSVWKDNTIIYQQPFWNDYFLTGFRAHLFLRNSCYHCKYASHDRVADITLGDYWGINKEFRERNDISDGISVVLINSEKGREAFTAINNECIFAERRPLEEAIGGNPRYNIFCSKHANTDRFILLYSKKGFRYAAKKTLRKERMKNFLYMLKRFIKMKLVGIIK